MKKTILVATLLLATLCGFGQGIEFFHGSYEEALAKAKGEGKHLFIDVYTTWCGPCKMMARDVFTDKSVGDYFNKNFVSMKLDAENQASSGFFKKYKANGYPSFFWLTSNGDLMNTETGACSPAEFVKKAEKALTSNLSAKVREAEERWHKGDRSYAFVNEYLTLLSTVATDKVRPTAVEYVSTLTAQQLKSRQTYELLRKFMRDPINDVLFRTLLANIDTYATYDPTETFWINYYRLLIRNLNIARKEPAKYNELYNLINSQNFPHKQMFMDAANLESIMADKKYAESINLMCELRAKYPNFPFLYPQFFYSLILSDYFKVKTDDKESQAKLLAYCQEMMTLMPCQQNLLYLTSVYAKMGNYKKAYELLASIAFYPDPRLSNALYKQLNLPSTMKEYPRKGDKR